MVVVFGENVLSGEGKKRKQDRTARFFSSRMKNSFLKDSGPEKKLGVHFSPCFSLCFFPPKPAGHEEGKNGTVESNLFRGLG
jgi:hypothetical protein